MSQKGFLDIPEKVRQRVYELLYLHVEPLAPLHNKVDRRHHTVTFEGVALLRTCRQIHTEGSAVAYGANEWDFHPRGLIVLRDFLKCIGPRNRACLKRIAINLECWNKIQQEPPANEKSRLFPSATGKTKYARTFVSGLQFMYLCNVQPNQSRRHFLSSTRPSAALLEARKFRFRRNLPAKLPHSLVWVLQSATKDRN